MTFLCVHVACLSSFDLVSQVGDEIEEVYVTATAFDPEAKEADDFDTANTHVKFKVKK